MKGQTFEFATNGDPEEYNYVPKEINNTCCKVCGISTVAHSHPRLQPKEQKCECGNCKKCPDCWFEGKKDNFCPVYLHSAHNSQDPVLSPEYIRNTILPDDVKKFMIENLPWKEKCKSSPDCSHNTNGRDMDKPCSIEFPLQRPDTGEEWEEKISKYTNDCTKHFETYRGDVPAKKDFQHSLRMLIDAIRGEAFQISRTDAILSERERIREIVEKDMCRIAQVQNANDAVRAMQNRIGSRPQGGFNAEYHGLGMVLALSVVLKLLENND